MNIALRKKPVCFLFYFGIINITSDNSCGLMPSRTGDRMNIWTYFFIWNQNISRDAGLGEDPTNAKTESAVFHSNYGSILLSFPDITMGRTTNDGLTMATITYLSLTAGRQKNLYEIQKHQILW